MMSGTFIPLTSRIDVFAPFSGKTISSATGDPMLLGRDVRLRYSNPGPFYTVTALFPIGQQSFLLGTTTVTTWSSTSGVGYAGTAQYRISVDANFNVDTEDNDNSNVTYFSVVGSGSTAVGSSYTETVVSFTTLAPGYGTI